MFTREKVVRRPFHETIIDVIRSAYYSEMECLSVLIKRTKIPKGHDEIIAAWNQRAREVGSIDNAFGVSTDLLEQKEEAEAEELAKKQPQNASS